EKVHYPGNHYSFIRFHQDTTNSELLFLAPSIQSDSTLKKIAAFHEKLIQYVHSAKQVKQVIQVKE
ncbi:MAG: hypothetical protein ACOYOA_10200, partial [Saprospiraceae bacterium]